MVIICKRFEIMKSYIIILSVDCNTHLHILSKNKKFLNAIIIGENKGEEGQVGRKRTFFGRQKFLADGVAGGPQIWPGEKLLSSCYPP